MSLLIKALEQAARDRDSAKTGAPTAQAAAAFEPTVEPAPAPKASSATESAARSAVPSDAATTPRSAPGLALDASARTSRSSSASAAGSFDSDQQRARAASVIGASGGVSHTVLDYLRDHALMTVGALAGVFGIGFGIYVYLQITRPAMFAPQPQQAAQQAPVSTAAREPAPSTTAPGAIVAPVTKNELTALPVSSKSDIPMPQAQGQTPVESVNGVGTAPIPKPQVIRESASSRDDHNPPAARQMAPTNPNFVSARAREADRSRQDSIAVNATLAQPRVDPLLAQAYAALQAGKLDEARAAYTKLSQSEPLNIDALLGLAYIAAQENRSEDAMTLYMRILQINPRQAAAQAALIGELGRADPVASETRLKQLIAREPSPFLHFVLGNLYADQSLWPQAQQAYFQAHHLEPQNADYAYNVAVGLDHLRQNNLALDFYKRAEQLAAASGRANFDVSHARSRIQALSSQQN
jgi:Flp pilus assembly protein TadD